MKTLAKDTIIANARFFEGDHSKVPTMALTVGVGTVMDSREVRISTGPSEVFMSVNLSIPTHCSHTCHLKKKKKILLRS